MTPNSQPNRPQENAEDNGLPRQQGSQSKLDLQSLPPGMVVTIDGISSITRRPIGELIAQALGAALADSGRFYRSLTMSCLEAGVDLEDSEAVGNYCSTARLNVWLRREGSSVEEACLFVNGDLFNNDELASVHADIPKVAFTPQARDQVQRVLRNLEGPKRVVVLGRDIGARVFPGTPFKFFVTAPAGATPQLSSQDNEATLDFSYRSANRNNTIQPSGSVLIDGGALSAAQACERILRELVPQFVRHEEMEMRWVEDMDLHQ